MKKLFFISLLLLASSVKANSCDQLFDQLPETIQQRISQLTWIDINPQGPQDLCNFVIRYYPCTVDSKKELNHLLPEIIQQANPNCHLVSQGINHHTEGYCTAEKIIAECQ